MTITKSRGAEAKEFPPLGWMLKMTFVKQVLKTRIKSTEFILVLFRKLRRTV